MTCGSKPFASLGGSFGDGIAVLLSFTCLVHCLALPLLLTLLPAWSTWLDVPESFHFWVVVLAAPISLGVLVSAARGRMRYAPLWLGVAGMTALAVALTFDDPSAETTVTSLGALTLAFGHILNWRIRHRQGCGGS